MIIVIKHGVRRRATCPECGCIFEYEKEDIRYGTQRDWYQIVSCPDCGKSVDVAK